MNYYILSYFIKTRLSMVSQAHPYRDSSFVETIPILCAKLQLDGFYIPTQSKPTIKSFDESHIKHSIHVIAHLLFSHTRKK